MAVSLIFIQAKHDHESRIDQVSPTGRARLALLPGKNTEPDAPF
ncbi:MAG: hypothetical protein R6X17_08465 [Candidatus Competibacteraceae bacterium]